MSSDSDADDDIQLKQFLEATDTALLNNSMFQQKKDNVEHESAEPSSKKDLPKSQRYIIEENENSWSDFNLPESMQTHLGKKLSEILEKLYEFCDVNGENSPKTTTKYENRVRLLKGDDCFVNSYEDFKYDTKGPNKKPEIKRRVVYDATNHNINKNAFELVAVDGDYILSRKEVRTWATKKERKNKVFHYKMVSNGVLHAKEEKNEFSEIRHKNNWNEKKIKDFKKT